MRRWAVAVALTSMAARADALALPDVRRLALPDAKAVLFDIDGTLFDSDPVHLEAFRRVLAAEGRSTRRSSGARSRAARTR